MSARRRRSESRRDVLDEHGRPIRERIRRRRQELGLTASELARRAGISPAYMTRIEKGEKVPSESVAKALAKAVGDDPELYLAWVHARYFSDPESTLEGLQRVGYSDSPSPRTRLRMEREEEEKRVELLREERRRLEREIRQTEENQRQLHRVAERGGEIGASAEEDAQDRARPRQSRLSRPGSRLQRWAYKVEEADTLSAADLQTAGLLHEHVSHLFAEAPGAEASAPYREPAVRLPVLRYGLDPGGLPEEPGHVVDWMWLDPGLLPGARERLFAYRVDREDVAEGPTDLEPGALVILTRTVEKPPHPERFYAVRTPRSIERAEESGVGPVYVTRVRLSGFSLIVFPPGTSTDVEIIELGKDPGLSQFLVGECLLFVHRAPGRLTE